MTKKFKDIVKKNPEPAKGKFGINPMDPWSIKSGIAEATDKKDQVILNIPLLIRVLELAREDIKSDMDLHRVVEKLIQIRNKGVLTMKDYNTIAHIKENHIAIAMGKMLDDEGGMVLTQLEQLERAITMIRSYVGKDYEKQLPAWVQAKITIATDYADTVGTYLLSKNEKVTEAKDPCKTGYTQVGMKDKGGRQVPNCVPSKGVPKAKGYQEETELDEAQSKRMSGADKFRKFMANRDKQHTEFMKGIEGKSHAEKMQAMMDKIKSNLNKEEVDLEEAKHYPYKFRATYHDPDTNEVTHYMDFTHRNLEAAKKHAKNSVLQRKDGKEDKLHSVVQMKEEVEQIGMSTEEHNLEEGSSYEKTLKTTTYKPFKAHKGIEVSSKKAKTSKRLHQEYGEDYHVYHGTTKNKNGPGKEKLFVVHDRPDDVKFMHKHSDEEKKAILHHLNKNKHLDTSAFHKSQIPEEVEQIDELNYDTIKSLYKKRRDDYRSGDDVGFKKKGKKVSAKNVAAANSRLMGYKPTQNQPQKEEVNKKEMSKSARIIKSLYKKHKMTEDMTDWKKEDKSVQTYGKKPKIQTTPKKDSFGEEKPKAAIIMSGGKTMTGQTRDTVEIDPMLKKRSGPDDFTSGYGKKQPQ